MFLLLILCLIPLAATSPILHPPRITVVCGDRHVSHANVKFYEIGGGTHVELERLHRFTDEHGHYHFPADVDFQNIHLEDVTLKIRDQCGIEGKKINCNLPYHHYDIPLKQLFTRHQTHRHQVLLDLNDAVWEPYRGTHCL